MKYQITFIFTCSLLVVACSKPAKTIEEVLNQSGCQPIGELTKGENIFNAKSIKCSNKGRVYWYTTPESQEAHTKVCASAGGKLVKTGKYWTFFNPSC